jgi:hypothetical protein
MKADSSALRFDHVTDDTPRHGPKPYPPAARLDIIGKTREDIDKVYPSDTIGRSSACLMTQRMHVSDELDVEVRLALNFEFVPSEQQDSTGERVEAMQILIQSHLLDAAMPQLMARHAGKVVVYHDGKVLAEGDTEADAVSRIPARLRSLPAVVRRIDDEEPEFMGGPKGF